MPAANIVEPGTPEYAEALAQLRGEAPRRHKYNAQPIEVDGERFDSTAEMARWGELQMLERAGYISGLRRQVRYVLQEKAPRGRFRKHAVRAITYTVDFQYTEAGRLIAEDFKGYNTDASRLRQKLFVRRYPDIVLRLTGRNRPTVAERE